MKKFIKILAGVICCLVLLIALFFGAMAAKTKGALDAQENMPIDMEKVADGTYTGTSNGGMVNVEVAVTVENHKIVNVDLIKQSKTQ